MTGITARLRCWMLLAVALLAIPVASYSQIGFGISINVAPPELPYYEQPPCPDEGYIWTPGYWAYGDDDYYWVPGTWVLAPRPGYLWTPAYWGWGGNGYIFHSGYWGEHIGFYGGINYGYGYFGDGYDGGYWDRGVFNYNTAVTNVNTTVITNIYNQTVVNDNTTVNNISYNGGAGGIAAQPTAVQLVAARERHVQPTNLQVNHEIAAKTNPSQYVKVNAGKPIVAATPKPGLFQSRGVVAAAKAGRLPQNATNSADANTVDNRSGNPNTMSKTATNARTDRPPSAQRPVANNSSRTNLTSMGTARNNRPLFDNRKPATPTASTRGDRPPSANRPTINGANGLNSTSARTLANDKSVVATKKQPNSPDIRSDRPPLAQHNAANTTIPSGRDGRRFNVATRLALPQRNDRPNTATNRLPLPQYNNHANLGQRNERFTSPQHSDRPAAIYSNTPNSRRPPSVPSNPGTMNRQAPPQQQSSPRYQNLPSQRQSAPPQRYNPPPQRQSAPPQRQTPPPPYRSAPQSANHPATPPSHQR